MFLKEVVEVRRVFEAQRVTNLGNIPIGVLQKDFGFACQPVEYVLAGRPSRCLPDSPVKVVDMNSEFLGEVPRRP